MKRLLGAVMLMVASACSRGVPARTPTLTAASTKAHGLWAWRTRELLDDGTPLLAACRAAGANEVYLAVTRDLLSDPRLALLLTRLRGEGIRVEALMGDPSWSKAEKWPSMLALIDDVIAYDRHTSAPFAAIHLDIEPHTLPENRGVDVGAYLPTYTRGLKLARARTEDAGLFLSADVPRKFFLASERDRRDLAGAGARLFLMLYELPRRGGTSEDASEELAKASAEALRAAYERGGAATNGEMIVGLSVGDYGPRLERMLGSLDVANAGTPQYAGWAIHDFSQYVARP